LQSTVYLITPPFTQLNTPYPATAYLKGFLNTKGISSFQSDLGIEVTIKLFSSEGLTRLFENISLQDNVLAQHPTDIIPKEKTANAQRIIQLRAAYMRTIDSVIGFLQGKNPTLAHLIAGRNYLPEASRFEQLDDLQWAFGNMGVQDKAKHIATLYLEDLSDLIKECVDEHFGFSRYAERLGRSASSFDELYAALQQPPTFIDQLLLELLQEKMVATTPTLVALSVPFPGNLYAAFRIAQYIRTHFPTTKVAMGGGFPNTELRQLSDVRVFEFLHFITLDDGEAPVENLLKYIHQEIPIDLLKRTLILDNNEVAYFNSPIVADYKQAHLGTPDYGDLLLDQYISAIEILNPMHRLWSDGRWNKLTMAHGCYWGKCTFCDVSLDYIQRYEPATASLLCDRMEELITQTGVNGFHFVDEAAPPSLMRAMAIEIIRRGLVVSWWTNVRFEKSFTRDLCLLLKASGCIGVSGGLEVASDRLLELIQKGITVAQVAKVNKHFMEAGIMVHAYLMYGFPTQTAQETIDSLEMVRQLFETGVLQSAFWHLFAMTAHSPVGLEPDKYKVKKRKNEIGTFANNDIEHIDLSGVDHEQFSFGLKKSLLNYMHGACLDFPLQKWFEQKVPKTTVPSDFILKCLTEEEYNSPLPSTKIIYLGIQPQSSLFTKSKKGSQWEMMEITFQSPKETLSIKVDKDKGVWLVEMLDNMRVFAPKVLTYQAIKEDYEKRVGDDFELFFDNKPVNTLFKAGMLKL
jgi:radical SAM superfamily enzyme YgiQ (UPF0313 family)